MKKIPCNVWFGKIPEQTTRKILALILVLVTVAGTVPIVSPAVFAQEDRVEIQAEDAVEEIQAEDAVEETQAVDETNAQPADKEPAQSTESEDPAAAETKDGHKAESKKEGEQPEDTIDVNGISGMLWLDTLEDAGSGAVNGDGIRQEEEQPIADYTVNLYKAADKTTAVETVQTKADGIYLFEQLEPGCYVVGISTCTKDDIEYLLPVAGITDDNKFTDFDGEYITVYSEEINIKADTVVTDVNAGIRTLVEVATFAEIQPSKSDLYVRNKTQIAFGGRLWWVIGDSSASTPASLRSSGADIVTLYSVLCDADTMFNPAYKNNNYNGSILQQEITKNYNSQLDAKEKGYVIPRASMDLQSWPIANAYNYADPINQEFWPLSVQEFNDIGAYYRDENARSVRGDAISWLRTPSSDYTPVTGYAGYVTGSTGCPPRVIYYSHSVRPAFYLDLSSVLFVSSNSGAGQKPNAGGKGLTSVNAPSGPLKLTMIDDTNLALNTSTTVLTSMRGEDVTFSYTGARTGANRSVSVMLCDSSGNLLYYGRPVDLNGGSANGTGTFTVPAYLAAGDYTVRVFNEEVNPSNGTDYASTPKEFTLRVRNVTMSLSVNTQNKVYTDGTSGAVKLNIAIKNDLGIPGSTIEKIEWFRVPVSDWSNYSGSFAGKYGTVAATDKGILSDPSTNHVTAKCTFSVEQNATYWVRGIVKEGSNTFTRVESIKVSNIYQRTQVFTRGVIADTSPVQYLYGYEPVNGTYGIPYDLGGMQVLSSPSNGFDKITLDIKSPYATNWNGTMKSGTTLPLILTLNKDFMDVDTPKNTECDSGDYTKYTIVCRASTTSLTIGKTVTGTYGDPNRDFAVTVTLTQAGAPLAGSFPYTQAGSSATMTFDGAGNATFLIRDGQSRSITGLPQGAVYQVEETDGAISSGLYTVTYSGTGTVTPGGNAISETLSAAPATVQLTNDRSTVAVTGVTGGSHQMAIAGALGMFVIAGVTVLGIWQQKCRQKQG